MFLVYRYVQNQDCWNIEHFDYRAKLKSLDTLYDPAEQDSEQSQDLGTSISDFAINRWR